MLFIITSVKMSSNSHKSQIYFVDTFQTGCNPWATKRLYSQPGKKNVLRNRFLDIELDCHVTNQKNHGTLWNLVLLCPCTPPWNAVKSESWRRFEFKKTRNTRYDVNPPNAPDHPQPKPDPNLCRFTSCFFFCPQNIEAKGTFLIIANHQFFV